MKVPSRSRQLYSQCIQHLLSAHYLRPTQFTLPPLPPKSKTAHCLWSSISRTEGLICWPDPSHREAFCLPGARVSDVARKLPGLVRPSDYYPLLVMQVAGDEIMERSPKAIKRDFSALGQLVEGSGAQVVFSSIPSVAGKKTERDKKTHLI